MNENILQTLQKLVQDVIAPDVRELKVRVASLEKEMDVRFNAVDLRFNAIDQRFNAMDQKIDQRFNAMDQKIDQRLNAMDQKNQLQFQAIMAAISESKAQGELATMRAITALSERVAVLESRQQ
jgi:hypothetical protein